MHKDELTMSDSYIEGAIQPRADTSCPAHSALTALFPSFWKVSNSSLADNTARSCVVITVPEVGLPR